MLLPAYTTGPIVYALPENNSSNHRIASDKRYSSAVLILDMFQRYSRQLEVSIDWWFSNLFLYLGDISGFKRASFFGL